MAGFIKDNVGVWRPMAKAFVKTSSGWAQASKGFLKTVSGWVQIFTATGTVPTITTEVTISQSTGSTGLVTLTGTNYHWNNFSSGIYRFEVSTDLMSWSSIDAGNITNPSIGSPNTVTYTILQSNLTANTENYFRFSVTATSSTNNSNTSTSGNTTVQMPRDITNLAVSSKDSSSVSLTWTPSQYANRQILRYRLAPENGTPGPWKSAPEPDGITGVGAGGYDNSVQSKTISGLSSGTRYEFSIIPWTGTANNYGYYGNTSNVPNAITDGAPAVPSIDVIFATGGGSSTPYMSWDIFAVNSESYAFTITRTGGTNPGTSSGTTNGSNYKLIITNTSATSYVLTITPYTGLNATGTAGTTVTTTSKNRTDTNTTEVYNSANTTTTGTTGTTGTTASTLPTITSLSASAPAVQQGTLTTVTVSWASTNQVSYFLNVTQVMVANYLDYGTTETSSSTSDSGSAFNVYPGGSVTISLTVYNGANQTGQSATQTITYTPPESTTTTGTTTGTTGTTGTTAPPGNNGTTCTTLDRQQDTCRTTGCDIGGCGSGPACAGTINRC